MTDFTDLKVGDEVAYGKPVCIAKVTDVKKLYVTLSDNSRWSLSDFGTYPKADRSPWRHSWIRGVTDADRLEVAARRARHVIDEFLKDATCEQLIALSKAVPRD